MKGVGKEYGVKGILRSRSGALLIALLWTFAFAFITFYYPIYCDQGTFLYVARGWETGLLPFRDALDTKPIGIYALYALADLIFGQSNQAFRILEALLMAVTVLPLHSLFRRLGRDPVGALLSHFVLAGLYYIGTDFMNLGQVEGVLGILALFLTQILVVYFQTQPKERKWAIPYLAGLLLGAMSLLKQNYALAGAIFPLFLFVEWLETKSFSWREKITPLLIFLAGAALLPLLTALYYVYNGALNDLYYGMFRLPLLYARHAGLPIRNPLSYATMILFNGYFVILVALGLAASFRSGRISKVPVAMLVLLLAAVLLQRKFWIYHFLSLLPLLAYFIGRGFQTVTSRFRESRWSRVVVPLQLFLVGLEIVLLGAGLYGPAKTAIGPSNAYRGALPNTLAYLEGNIDTLTYYGGFYGNFSSPKSEYELALRLSRLTAPGETVQLFEFRPSVYIYADRRAPHRFFFGSILLLVGRAERERLQREFVRLTYRTRRPDWIVFGLDGPWKSPQIAKLNPELYGYELKERLVSRYHPRASLRQVTLGLFKKIPAPEKN